MLQRRLIRVALFLGALPVYSQTAFNHKTQSLLRFTLDEKPERIVVLLGRPDRVDDSARAYHSWLYEQRITKSTTIISHLPTYSACGPATNNY